MVVTAEICSGNSARIQQDNMITSHTWLHVTESA